MARIYAVASAKGGVGKTTTTANLGAALAASGYSVAVVDGDLAMPNLAAAVGVDVSEATLHDVLAGRASVEDATYRAASGVDVVPGDGSLDAFAAADPSALHTVLTELDSYDFVLVDTGSGLTHDAVLPLGLADAVFLVCNTERDALGDTDKTREVTQRLGGTVAGVVLTRVDPENPNAEEVASRLDATVIEAIPSDDAVVESVAASVPVSTHAPDSPAAAAYAALAETVEAYEPGAKATAQTDDAEAVEENDGADEDDDTEAVEGNDDAEAGEEPVDAGFDDGGSAPAESAFSIANAEAKLGIGGDEITEGVDDDETAESGELDEGNKDDATDPVTDAIVEAEGTADAVDEATVDDEDGDSDDEVDGDDGVFDTALVEEAENTGAAGDDSDRGATATDEGEANGAEEADEGEDEETADEETEKRGKDRGFLGRLLR